MLLRDGSQRWRVVVLAAALAGLAFLGQARAVLPAKYFYDSDYIAAVAHGTTAVAPDPYYRATVAFYARLGLVDHPRLTAVLELALVAGVVLLAVPAALRATLRWSTVVLAVAAVGLGTVYLTQFSKDTAVLLVVAALLAVLRFGHGVPAAAAVGGTLLLYAWLFRDYWLVVAGLFAATYPLLRSLRRLALLPAAIAGMFGAAALAAHAWRHTTLDTFRLAANAGRAGSPAAVTMIAPYFDDPHSAPVGLANAALTFLALLFPVPLALAGGALHIAAAVLITAYTVRLLGAVRRCASADGADAVLLDRLRIAVAVLVGFLVTQALFAPDYGSHLKHLTPMLPLAVFAFAIADRLRSDPYGRSTRRPSDQ